MFIWLQTANDNRKPNAIAKNYNGDKLSNYNLKTASLL